METTIKRKVNNMIKPFGAVHIVLATILFAYMPTEAFADDSCSGLKDFFGLCTDTKMIKETGAQLGSDLKTSTDTMYSAVNFWSQLIQWYYAGTPEQKQKAQAILNGVFGTKDLNYAAFQWEVALSFRGIDTTKHSFQVAILPSYKQPSAEDLKKKIASGAAIDLNPTSIVANKPPSPSEPTAYYKTIEQVRDAVKVQSKGIAQQIGEAGAGSAYGECSSQNGENWTKSAECLTLKAQDRLATAILAVADRRLDLVADQPLATQPWLGEQWITLVIPTEDLASQPNLEVLTIRAKDRSETVLPIFARHPRSISRYYLVNAPQFSSPDPAHGGQFSAFTMEMISVPVIAGALH